MVDQHTPPRQGPAPGRRTWREAWRAARRNPDGTPRRTPMPALLVMLVASGVLVPLFLLGNSEDLAYSASTTGTQGPGGETSSYRSAGSTSYTCRDAPVEFEVDGRLVAGTDGVSGRCVPSGETRTVTVRYVPGDPDDFTTNPRQWMLYGFIAVMALAFLATLVAIVRRLRADRGRRAAAS